MSAILGIFGPGAGAAPARAMLAHMAARGADLSDLYVTDEVVLGVTRHAWECKDGFAGPAQVVEERDCVCVSDATLYYRDDLRRALAASGIEVDRAASPASLIIAAYRAWGAECATKLEGDFAFILWDRRERRVVASREFTGKRPLFHASLGAGQAQLVIASSVRAVATHPACVLAYDARVITATMAFLWAATDETWHRSVREVRPGFTLTREQHVPARVTRHWMPTIATGPTLGFDEAAEQLRALLERATVERMAPTGPTAVWMSGGWDSSSVFAAGQSRLRATGDQRLLLPVSLSFPERDPGREDELIQAIAAHWQSPIRWIDIETVPLFVDAVRRASDRDTPYAHTYEHANRRLAAEASALGATVAFDGNGGDQLFQVSDIFLADLLRQGRWVTLAREWRAKHPQGGVATWRRFLRDVLVPAAPAWARGLVEQVRGRPFSSNFVRIYPNWIRADFLRTQSVREWERANLDQLRGASEWTTESLRYLTMPTFGRAFAEIGSFARDEGVELRSPLLDARIVALAMGRPRTDRNTKRETKRLLRRSMRGLLPDEVLAPRTHRTGVSSGYTDRRLRESIPGLMEELFSRPLMLAELGIVEPGALRGAWDECLRTSALNIQMPLYMTLQAEFWLRARHIEATGRPDVSRAVAGHRGIAGDVRQLAAVELSS